MPTTQDATEHQVLVDLSKHLVKPGLYFVSIPNGWPCSSIFRIMVVESNFIIVYEIRQILPKSDFLNTGVHSGVGIQKLEFTLNLPTFVYNKMTSPTTVVTLSFIHWKKFSKMSLTADSNLELGLKSWSKSKS